MAPRMDTQPATPTELAGLEKHPVLGKTWNLGRPELPASTATAETGGKTTEARAVSTKPRGPEASTAETRAAKTTATEATPGSTAATATISAAEAATSNTTPAPAAAAAAAGSATEKTAVARHRPQGTARQGGIATPAAQRKTCQRGWGSRQIRR